MKASSMRFEVLEAIITRRGTLRPGQVVDLPADLVDRMGGKVRPVDPVPRFPTPYIGRETGALKKNVEISDPGDLHHLIDATLLEIDATRPNWSGWRQSLTTEQRDRLRDLESEIDLASLAGDRRRLTAALAKYKTETLKREDF